MTTEQIRDELTVLDAEYRAKKLEVHDRALRDLATTGPECHEQVQRAGQLWADVVETVYRQKRDALLRRLADAEVEEFGEQLTRVNVMAALEAEALRSRREDEPQ